MAKLRARLHRRFTELRSRARWRASSPPKPQPKPGGRFKCRVRGSAVVWTLTVTQLDGVGRRVRLRGTPKYENPKGLPGKYVLRAKEDLAKSP